MQTTLEYLGRILFGGYFVYSGIHHFLHVKQMAMYTQSKGVPMASTAVVVTGVLLLIGGVAVLLQQFLVIGLLALLIFLIPVTFLMHAFWKISDPMGRMGERVNFTKNLALLGAVLLLLAQV